MTTIHDPRGRRLPIKLDATSNSEFAPVPLPAAAQEALAGDEFIFDVQLHHVNPQSAWRKRAGPNAFKGLPNANCGKADHVECFSSEQLLKDVFLDSDTAMGVLSHVPGGADTNPLDFEAAGATRLAANALDGTERLLLHGRCMPTLARGIEGMDAQAARGPLAGFKTYTQFGPRDGAAGFQSVTRRWSTPGKRPCRAARTRQLGLHPAAGAPRSCGASSSTSSRSILSRSDASWASAWSSMWLRPLVAREPDEGVVARGRAHRHRGDPVARG